MKSLKIVAFIFLLTAHTMTAIAGTYAADFLNIGVGARPAAMGGAFVAVADDPTAFFWNPA